MPMYYTRQRFDVSTNSSPWVDTGVPYWGELLQIAWSPTTADTGADLQITLMPRPGDTGQGWSIFNDNDCLGADFVRAPRQSHHAFNGSPDTGHLAPFVAAGDRLRVKVTPGGSAVAGKLYVWTRS